MRFFRDHIFVFIFYYHETRLFALFALLFKLLPYPATTSVLMSLKIVLSDPASTDITASQEEAKETSGLSTITEHNDENLQRVLEESSAEYQQLQRKELDEYNRGMQQGAYSKNMGAKRKYESRRNDLRTELVADADIIYSAISKVEVRLDSIETCVADTQRVVIQMAEHLGIVYSQADNWNTNIVAFNKTISANNKETTTFNARLTRMDLRLIEIHNTLPVLIKNSNSILNLLKILSSHMLPRL